MSNLEPIFLAYAGNSTDAIAPMELQLTYTVLEVLVAIVAVVGNAMVILVFWKERRLRRRTNYYIVSLAVADLLVGLLGIPFAIMAAIGLPTNLHACLFTLSILIVLCTISIFCLVAVSVDRYWAILHPLAYSRNVRTKTAVVIISLCWVAGSAIGFLPLFGWHAATSHEISCFFVKIMDYDFLVFLYFATIITPSLILAAFYAHIYRVVIRQLRQIVTMNPGGGNSFRGNGGSSESVAQSNGTMLRVLGAAQKREVKATKNLSIIVLFFIICWIPLYTINCVKAFCPDCYIGPAWTDFCIILSHLNSAVNPLLYAYHLKDFRAAMKSLIYTMFGMKDNNPIIDTYYKPSLVSQHRQSNRANTFPSNQPKIYIDSPVWLRQRVAEISISHLGIASGSEITMAFKKNTLGYNQPKPADSEDQKRREIWMITEVPSASDDHKDEDDDVFLPSNEDQLASVRYDFNNDNVTSIDIDKNNDERDDFDRRNLNSTINCKNGNSDDSIFIVHGDNDQILTRTRKISTQNGNCHNRTVFKSSPIKKFLASQSAPKLVRNEADPSEKQGSSNILQYLDLNGVSNDRFRSKNTLSDR